jgi:glycosyltransferase involved in cell wall biosynthesis
MNASKAKAALDLIVLVPVYDDWETARWLLGQLDDALAIGSVTARLVFVDDCSQTPAAANLVKCRPERFLSVESLRLRRNLGHQRAIAIGLSFISEERPCDAVLVMDGDGEDKPGDVPRLIAKFLEENASKVIFAKRVRRSEGRLFRVCYFLYRLGHRVLTGIAVRVGNFSILPVQHLSTLVAVSETWNHYAASVFKSRIPYAMLATERGKRLTGKSKMDFVALVTHGLSAISVFAETVGVRLTLAALALVLLMIALLGTVLAIRFSTDLAIPGWATTAAGLLLVIVLQMLTVTLGLTLLVLFNRNNLSFLPLRDYRYFVAGVQQLYERAE